MSTRSIIIKKHSRVGRYVHYDGYQVGTQVQKILDRDGHAALDILFKGQSGWSSIEEDTNTDNLPEWKKEANVINGYGEQYENGDDRIPLKAAKEDGGIEYIHIIDTKTLTVKTIDKFNQGIE